MSTMLRKQLIVQRRILDVRYPTGFGVNVRRTTDNSIPTQNLELRFPGENNFESFVEVRLAECGKALCTPLRSDFNLFLDGFPGKGTLDLGRLRRIKVSMRDLLTISFKCEERVKGL